MAFSFRSDYAVHSDKPGKTGTLGECPSCAYGLIFMAYTDRKENATGFREMKLLFLSTYFRILSIVCYKRFPAQGPLKASALSEVFANLVSATPFHGARACLSGNFYYHQQNTYIKNEEENPLLLLGQSHFASQNKED